MRRALSWRWRVLGLLACALVVDTAGAHDSWLSRIDPPSRTGPAQFAFATGSLYPLAGTSPSIDSVSGSACADGQGRTRALRAEARGGTLVLRTAQAARGSAPDAALGCWAELRAHEITITPELVDVYFREIRPGAPVVTRWAALREQGTPWQERYRKFARIEVSARDTPAPVLRAIRRPAGLPLEIVATGDAPLVAGSAAQFQVLSNNAPVAGLAVELRSERSPLGVWATSDAEGRLRYTLPFGGGWLLRATLLEADAATGWQSRFVTLAFDAH